MIPAARLARLLRRASAAPLALGVVLAACADDAPLRDAPLGLDTTAGDAPDGDLHDDDGDDGLPPPNDDPAIGGVDDDGDDGDTTPPDAGPASTATAVRGNDCVVGGTYCGGNKVGGDPATLYRCKSAEEATRVETCARGCSINPGRNDSCKADPAARVASPVPGKSVTYAYGVRNPRYAAGYHTGEDYATPTGSNAVAVRSGTIRWSNDAGGAYGKWIGLDADNGRTYVYCHLSSRLVASGTKVTAGQVIAKTGATGNVTGPHLHFEDHPLGPFRYGQVRKPAW